MLALSGIITIGLCLLFQIMHIVLALLAEFLILKDFDLAELRAYEQAKELTTTLLKKWLVKYKFKNWSVHSSNGNKVTEEDKKKRAEEIAKQLGDNKRKYNMQSFIHTRKFI